MVERAAFARSINEAWALLAAVAIVALALVWLLGKPNRKQFDPIS